MSKANIFDYYRKALYEGQAALSKVCGIVEKNHVNAPIFFIADVHGRPGFIFEVERLFSLEYKKNKDVQIVFLGDYMHGEGRAQDRWKDIDRGFDSALDEEMHQNMKVLSEISWCCAMYPNNFTVLRGNHDFVEDYFRKYANSESEHCSKWFIKHDLFDLVYLFEREMSLIFRHGNTIASHSMPCREMCTKQNCVLDQLKNKSLSISRMFTWVNYLSFYDWAMADKCAKKLFNLKDFTWIAGHRPQEELCAKWITPDENIVYQLNNPEKYTVIKYENGKYEAMELEQSENAKHLDRVGRYKHG